MYVNTHTLYVLHIYIYTDGQYPGMMVKRTVAIKASSDLLDQLFTHIILTLAIKIGFASL